MACTWNCHHRLPCSNIVERLEAENADKDMEIEKFKVLSKKINSLNSIIDRLKDAESRLKSHEDSPWYNARIGKLNLEGECFMIKTFENTRNYVVGMKLEIVAVDRLTGLVWFKSN